MKFEDYKKINSKDDFLNLVFELLDENDSIEWENDTAYSFLQTLAAWLDDAEGFYRNFNINVDANEASWQLFADALQAACSYE